MESVLVVRDMVYIDIHEVLKTSEGVRAGIGWFGHFILVLTGI